jgi:ribosomal protein L37AE/L43A
MSIRCKVCNASKISNAEQITPNTNWECQSCGNLLDTNGYIVTPN